MLDDKMPSGEETVHPDIKPSSNFINFIETKSLPESEQLPEQTMSHTMEKVLQCPFFNISFSGPYYLSLHQRTHSVKKTYV